MDDVLSTLSARVGKCLGSRGWRLACAESCTGGWIAEVVTATAGSSGWFDCGFVTYSNSAKQDLLGVPGTTLEQFGAVSEATVAAMVAGTLAASRAEVALAVSGIAGPGGAMPGKPVGTVCFAWRRRNTEAITQTRHFPGDREAVRRAAVIYALSEMVRHIRAADN
jgi:nicotinamide-nucleotide amidase